jgi:hypothetical protein
MHALFVWLISHQPAVLFSQNKPAITNQPAVHSEQTSTGHQPNEQAVYVWLVLHVYKTSFFYLAVCIHNNMCINLYELQHGNSMRLPFQQTKN